MPKLNKYREQIDKIDKNIIQLLSKRMLVVKKIKLIKTTDKIPIVDKNRWSQKHEKILKQSNKLGLPKKLVITIFNLIHEFSIQAQK